MKKMTGLAARLSQGGGTIAGAETDAPPATPLPTPPAGRAVQVIAPSRAGLVAITVHAPEAVRRQLKAIAAEEGRSMEDIANEAFNLVFAKYRRPEIAPRKHSN